MYRLETEDGPSLLVIGKEGEVIPPPRESAGWTDILTIEGLLSITGRGARSGALEAAFRSPTYLSKLTTVHSVHRLPAWHFDGRYIPARPGLMHSGRRATLYVGEKTVLPEADPSFPLLNKWLSGIIFSEPHGEGNLLGLVISMFARHTYKGFPHLVLGAPYPSSGKTAVAESITRLLLGKKALPATYKSDQEKFETAIGTRFADKPGPSVIFIDNVNGKRGGAGGIIANQALAGMAASTAFGLNKHYSSIRPVFSPIVLFTFNDARVQADLRDKVVQVHMTRPPKERHRKLEPHPDEFVELNRLGMLAEIGLVFSKIPSQPAGLTYPIRYYEAAYVAQAAAQILGKTYNYDLAANETADGVLQDMYYALEDCDGNSLSLQDFTSRLDQAKGEVHNLLENVKRNSTGKVKFIRRYVEDNIADQEHKFQGHKFQIVFGGKGVKLEVTNE